MTSLPLTSLPATSFPVTSLPVAHLSQIMMVYRSSKQSSTDHAPNMLPPPSPPPPPPPPLPQYSQSNDEEPYYILKTNNPFWFWEPLYCNVFHCYCCLCHENRIHTCNTINILIGHQLFNDDFINDGKCFTT